MGEMGNNFYGGVLGGKERMLVELVMGNPSRENTPPLI
jgi:hypothetical protein